MTTNIKGLRSKRLWKPAIKHISRNLGKEIEKNKIF